MENDKYNGIENFHLMYKQRNVSSPFGVINDYR